MASVCTEQTGKETNILCLYSHMPSGIQRRANMCDLKLKSLTVIYINFWHSDYTKGNISSCCSNALATVPIQFGIYNYQKHLLSILEFTFSKPGIYGRWIWPFF